MLLTRKIDASRIFTVHPHCVNTNIVCVCVCVCVCVLVRPPSQLLDEGAVQMLRERSDDGNGNPILAAVGTLQFDGELTSR